VKGLTRRQITTALLASAPALTYGAAGRAQVYIEPQRPGVGASGGLRVRKDIKTLGPNDPDMIALRDGVARMRADTGPLSWDTQRRVHAQPWGHHNSWRFLPWHRFQLYYWERIMAKASGYPDFAMPYWNWDDDHAPAVFFHRTSPLFDDTRTITAASSIARYIGFERQSGAPEADFWGRTSNDFNDFFGTQNPTGEAGAGFGGSAEQYGHNLVHLFVGGRMRNLNESPLDPLFWAHHSNVDRQWAMWTDIHGPKLYPPEWGNETCSGYVDADGFLAPVRTGRECADTRQLGFTYDNLDLARRQTAPERWPGVPDPTPQRVAQQTLTMQRQSPSLGRIFLPPQMLANLKGAYAPEIDVSGFLQVMGMDGYVVHLTSRSIDLSHAFLEDALFAVPMGGMGMRPMGHKAQLKALIPRDLRALSEGIWLEAEARPLRGVTPTSGMAPELVTFVVDYRAQI
jgi:hypothetical protein